MRVTNQNETRPSIEVRRATPADREPLTVMYRNFEPKAAAFGLPPRHDIERWLDSLSGCAGFVAVAEGRAVGHAVFCAEGRAAEVAIFIHQEFRHRGLGKRLLGQLISGARRLALRQLWLVVEPGNISMFRLARSVGFTRGKELGRLCLDLRPPTEHLQEQVRRRAYEIYLVRGNFPGDALEDWFQAERELHSEQASQVGLA